MISGIIPFGDEYHTSSPDSFSLCICNNSSLLILSFFSTSIVNLDFFGEGLVDVYIVPHPVSDFFGYGFFRVTRSVDLVVWRGWIKLCGRAAVCELRLRLDKIVRTRCSCVCSCVCVWIKW